MWDIVKTVVPDPGKQLEIQQEMTEKLLAQEAAVMDSTKAVMTADSTSQNRFVSTARPAVVYWSMAMGLKRVQYVFSEAASLRQ